MSRCEWCGTEVDTDNREVHTYDQRNHGSTVCRGYLRAALNAANRECSELQGGLELAERRIDDERKRIAAEVRRRLEASTEAIYWAERLALQSLLSWIEGGGT